ncbi:MAG: GntR family transcriptional regulator [Oscillospiraceae bacterium]|nr:GntR family transcriptional regulator [Oscillospiraceae bacterium]
MKWQFRNDMPIYTQIVEQIKVAIVRGEYGSGERLPSVRDMATEAGVNPNTMQRAMAELEREGLVFSQRTSGRQVTENLELIKEAKLSQATKHLESFMNAMGELGLGQDEIIKLIMAAGKGEENNGNTDLQ